MAHGDGQGAYALNPVPGYNVRSDRLLQRYKDAEEKHNVTVSHINGVDFGRTIEPLIKKIVRGQASASEAFSSIAEQTQSYIDSHYNDYLDKQ